MTGAVSWGSRGQTVTWCTSAGRPHTERTAALGETGRKPRRAPAGRGPSCRLEQVSTRKTNLGFRVTACLQHPCSPGEGLSACGLLGGCCKATPDRSDLQLIFPGAQASMSQSSLGTSRGDPPGVQSRPTESWPRSSQHGRDWQTRSASLQGSSGAGVRVGLPRLPFTSEALAPGLQGGGVRSNGGRKRGAQSPGAGAADAAHAQVPGGARGGQEGLGCG